MSKFSIAGASKGIGAGLLNQASQAAGGNAFRVVNLPLSSLVLHPLNDEIYPPQDITALKEMVQEQGLDQNLLVAPMPSPRTDREVEEQTQSQVRAMYPNADPHTLSQVLLEEQARAKKLNRCYQENPGKYLVISGNRRCYAYQLLHQEFPEIPAYESVPCKIIDNPDEAENGYVIRLITSNSSGREFSDYILLRQYEVLEREFLRQKAAGQKPGVKRKYLAAALKLSETQVQRLRTVHESLDPQLQMKIQTGELSIGRAAQLASLPQSEQLRSFAHQQEQQSTARREKTKAPCELRQLESKDLLPALERLETLSSLLKTPLFLPQNRRDKVQQTLRQLERLSEKLLKELQDMQGQKEP